MAYFSINMIYFEIRIYIHPSKLNFSSVCPFKYADRMYTMSYFPPFYFSDKSVSFYIQLFLKLESFNTLFEKAIQLELPSSFNK